MKMKWIIAIAAVAVLALALLLVPKSATAPVLQSLSSGVSDIVGLPTPTPHPLSVEARSAMPYNGHGLVVGRIVESTAAWTKHHVTYGSGGLTISGVLLIPTGAGPFPAVVLNHGHIDTAIYTNGRGLRREQDYLARHGYAVLHTDYRNHAQSDKDTRDELAIRLAYAEDAINAVYALKSANIPKINAAKVGMMGHSMGGGVTLNALVLQPDLVQAAVLYAPVTGDPRDSYERWMIRRPESAMNIASIYGTPTANSAFWDAINAQRYYDRIKAPVRMYHGTGDESVPLPWSQRTLALLTDAGVNADLTVYERAPHEFAMHWPQFMQSVTAFFDVNLR